jgi:uncharacterized damage-inducible protein DinB
MHHLKSLRWFASKLALLATVLAATVLTATVQTVQAQSAPTDYRDEFLGHFERSSGKIAALAEVVPEDLYDWSPMEGVMHVSQVYMHLARYNFMYLEDNLGIAAPDGIDVANLETITDKSEVVELFGRSVEHVREAVKRMTEGDLTATTILYGREVAGWAVLFQLLSHMNEHVGQSVAYARMNGIVPPWSR